MAKLIYTAAKGVFQTEDSNTTGAVSISDVAVTPECAPVGPTKIVALRFLDQGHSDGDGYASIDNTGVTVSDGQGNVVIFEFDHDNSGATIAGAVAVDLSSAAPLSAATPSDIATLLATAIDGNATVGGNVHPVVQSQVGANDSTSDYVEIYLYGPIANGNVNISSIGSILSSRTVQDVAHGANRRSIDGGLVLEAGRADDDATLQTKLGDVNAGALSNGTAVGQKIFAINNSTNRGLKFTGEFKDASNASRSNCSIAKAGEISELMWDGYDWIEVASISGKPATFS